MQHNRITMLSSSETCQLGSSSSNPAIDQQNLLPNNPTADEQLLLPNALESESYPQYLLNSHEVEIPSGNLISQQNTSLVDHANFFHAKREHLAPSLSIGGPLSIDRRKHEATCSFPSHNLNIDLNVNQADQFGSDDVDPVHSNGQSRTNTVSAHRVSSTTERIPHHGVSDAIGSSSRNADCVEGASGQEVHLLDSHHPTFKRKYIDGCHAESSANGSSRNHHQNNNTLLTPPTTCVNSNYANGNKLN